MIHTNRRYAAPVLAAALLAMAAGDGAAQGAIVRLPERDRPLAGAAAQVFSVGRAEGAEHEMFGIVGGVAFDGAENLYVLDRQLARVMVYDRTGRFLRQIGRKGEGPGELIVPTQLAIGGDGTVVVADLGRDAYSLFRADGTFIRNVQFNGWMPAAAALVWHPSGAVVGTYRRALRDQAQPGQSVTFNQSTPVLAIPLGGGEPRRVFEVPSQERVEQRTESPGPGQTQVMFRVTQPPAFTPQVLYGVLPNGNVALSFTTGYTVRIVDLNGQTLRYLQRPMRPRRTTQADRDRFLERRREEIASGRAGIVVTRGDGPGAPAGPGPDQLRRMQERQLDAARNLLAPGFFGSAVVDDHITAFTRSASSPGLTR